MKTLDGVSTGVWILVACFAIDRLVQALMFVLSYLPNFPDLQRPIRVPDSDPETDVESIRRKVEKNYRFTFTLFATLIALATLWCFPQLGVLSALGRTADPSGGRDLLDTILTAIIFVGGAKEISAYFKTSSGAPAPEPAPQPLKVSGTITLDNRTTGKS